MARPLRIEFPGAVYHVTVRGNEKKLIYRDDEDRRVFLELLGECVKRFGWIITAYVLMSNHFHLMVQLTQPLLSRGMQWLDGTYTQFFNRRHDRVGHLLQGRPNAPLVEKETYWLNLVRYIVLNPVRAGIAARPEDYTWSSYRGTAGLAPAPQWLNVDDVLGHFSPVRTIAEELYRDFVYAGIGSPWRPSDELVGQIYFGSESWLADMRQRVQSRPRDSAHPLVQRLVGERTMAEVITSVAAALSIDEAMIRASRGGLPRMLAAWLGCYEGQMPLSTIAAGLRLRSATGASKLIRQCDRELTWNRALQAVRDRCLATLRGEEKSVEVKL